ncbi:hypothetical protein GLOIN_2v1817865 [Rhizophagus clarus]|uniref:Uncharacterized protein n=1 Tax=Rhizophagus clarus TaxID=94130 RepID=A0A8H3R5L1_9GLOM|nr:hypothetical protein GLOIN_2v1817865 [Rhizophagus clarus]
METTHKNKKNKNAERLVKALRLQLVASKKSGGSPIVIQYKDEIEAILNKDRLILNSKSYIDSTASLLRKKEFGCSQEKSEINNEKEIPYKPSKIDRKYKNKCEINEVEDNQDRKKLKNNKTNLENTIQRLLEQQEVRQIESEKRREDQRAELFQMKQQNDFMLFNLLNNLTNCLSSLYRGSSEDNLPQFFTPSTPLPQFNNRETSMVYQNNIDDTSNDVEE